MNRVNRMRNRMFDIFEENSATDVKFHRPPAGLQDERKRLRFSGTV